MSIGFQRVGQTKEQPHKRPYVDSPPEQNSIKRIATCLTELTLRRELGLSPTDVFDPASGIVPEGYMPGEVLRLQEQICLGKIQKVQATVNETPADQHIATVLPLRHAC